MKRWFAGTLLLPCFLVAGLSGCRSAFINATLTNQTAQTVRLIEVDYPSASFGLQTLAPGAAFHYRFKVQGSGEVKLTFTDASGKTHTVTGPSLSQGQQGAMNIALTGGDQVRWDSHLDMQK